MRLDRLDTRLDVLDARVDSVHALASSSYTLLEQILQAQVAEVADRQSRRDQVLSLCRSAGQGILEIARAILTPGIIVPLCVVAVAAMALAYGASVTYGDLVIHAATGALEGSTEVVP